MTTLLECTITITLHPYKEGVMTCRVSREFLEVGRLALAGYLLGQVKSQVVEPFQLVSALCRLYESPRWTDETVAELDLLAQ